MFPLVVYQSILDHQLKCLTILCIQLIMDKRDRVEKEKVLAQYVVDSLNTHNFWAFKVT